MANTVTTSNMGLVLPVPTVELGPAWAAELNNALQLVDAHDHSAGKGVQITPAGINITADLPMMSNNLTQVRSTRYISNSAPLVASGSDVLAVYVSGVDLYYNDGSGNQVRITQGGSVTGSAGTITGLPSGTASASFVAGTGTFEFLQATSTAANMDAGTYILRYPGSYPTPSGNYIALQAPSSLASGYALFLPPLPAANNTLLSIATTGVISASLVLDGTTIGISGSTIGVIGVPALAITTAMIANQAVTAAKIANNTITLSQVALTTLNSGSYTPFTANIANANTFTAGTSWFSRVGNVITCGGKVSVAANSINTFTAVSVNLPFATALSGAYGAGTVYINSSITASDFTATVVPLSGGALPLTTTQLVIQAFNAPTSATDWYYIFIYSVV